MIILKLRRKVLAKTHKSKSDDTKVSIRKVFPRVKIMFMLKTTEKVNEAYPKYDHSIAAISANKEFVFLVLSEYKSRKLKEKLSLVPLPLYDS